MAILVVVSHSDDGQLPLLVRVMMILFGVVAIYQGADLFRNARWYRQQTLDEAQELDRERVSHHFPTMGWIGVMLAVASNKTAYARLVAAPFTAVVFALFGIVLIVLAVLVR